MKKNHQIFSFDLVSPHWNYLTALVYICRAEYLQRICVSKKSHHNLLVVHPTLEVPRGSKHIWINDEYDDNNNNSKKNTPGNAVASVCTNTYCHSLSPPLPLFHPPNDHFPFGSYLFVSPLPQPRHAVDDFPRLTDAGKDRGPEDFSPRPTVARAEFYLYREGH